ncbi:hypothetical protein chiPu_0025415 [Chiloscyllium punctatum]|uniref:Uncharacterized protein n=1 Tax=Chiloscyllium punctatum TaxID=137246 RepID=A0A401TF70_CHIPU|nr:hypothetical protein [Chiloscyllium punctatum]
MHSTTPSCSTRGGHTHTHTLTRLIEANDALNNTFLQYERFQRRRERFRLMENEVPRSLKVRMVAEDDGNESWRVGGLSSGALWLLNITAYNWASAHVQRLPAVPHNPDLPGL